MSEVHEDFNRLTVNIPTFQCVEDAFADSITREIAVPVAAMNALVYWIKVTMKFLITQFFL